MSHKWEVVVVIVKIFCFFQSHLLLIIVENFVKIKKKICIINKFITFKINNRLFKFSYLNY